jgi:diacylglycerol O-acyltransferase / wax synthase
VSTRMSPADAVWLRGDSEVNRVVISAILWFDAPVDFEQLRTRVEERIIARHPVFHQRAVHSSLPGVMPRREEDPGFDLGHHLTEQRLPPPGDHATLERVCSEERTTPLDPERPLWAATLHQGYRGDGCAVHVRIHHSFGDGLALMQLLMTLVDEFDPALVPLADEVTRADRLGRFAGRSVGVGLDLALRPWLTLPRIGAAADAVRWGAKLLAPAKAPRSQLQGQPNGRKRMTWSPDGLPVVDLLHASHERKVTANDLMLGVMAGGMRRYLLERDALVDEVLVLVPISMRTMGAPLPRSVGNRIGLLPVLLPTGVADHEHRVQLIRERTAALKGTRAPAVSHAITAGTTLLTPGIERAIHRMNQRFGTGVVTNVIGPDLELHVLGARIGGVIGWGGMTGDLNLGAGFISLGGRVYGGLVTDEAITPDPDRLLGHVEAEWREVLPSRSGAGVGVGPAA